MMTLLDLDSAPLIHLKKQHFRFPLVQLIRLIYEFEKCLNDLIK